MVLSKGVTGHATDSRRLQSLADEYYELLGLAPKALEAELWAIAQRELGLPEPMRYAATRARLEAWLRLDREERRIIGQSFRRVVDAMPEAARAWLHEAERGAVLNGMSFREFRELAPALVWQEEFFAEGTA